MPGVSFVWVCPWCLCAAALWFLVYPALLTCMSWTMESDCGSLVIKAWFMLISRLSSPSNSWVLALTFSSRCCPSNPSEFSALLHISAYLLCRWRNWDNSDWRWARRFWWLAVCGLAKLFFAVLALVLSVFSCRSSFLRSSLACGDVSMGLLLDVLSALWDILSVWLLAFGPSWWARHCLTKYVSCGVWLAPE